MVASIARQSVIQKCTMQKSVLLGNYEFYYLAGLLKKLFQMDLNEDMEPKELFDTIIGQLDTIEATEPKSQYLIKMVSVYRPLEEYDEQMKQLFRWGADEPDLWKMTTSYKPE